MASSDIDRIFAGSIPKLYDTYLVPLIFEPYALDLANRLGSRAVSRVLEVAAGTGAVTRALASTLPESVEIIATDLNQDMLDEASLVGTKRPVEWQEADAMDLRFPDESFDAVLCQFGVMFFPDRVKAFSEVHRVLKPGGVFIFNTWDEIKDNEFANTVTVALEPLFPGDPPRFLARRPHGYHDRRVIEQDLSNGGFARSPRVDVVAARSRATSPRIPAMAYCQGTPLRAEIESRDPKGLAEATDVAAEAIAKKFGRSAVDGKMQALIVTVES